MQFDRLSPADFFFGQIMQTGPIVLVAMAGAVALVTLSGLRRYAVIGWTGISAFFLMILLGAKSYYLAPIWPALLGVGIAEMLNLAARLAERGRRQAAQWVTVAPAVLIISYGAASLPLGIPFLPPEPMARYAARLGMTEATTTNTGVVLSLPQDYADMLGWERMVSAVAEVYHGLSADERERTVILGSNYGEAGAIDFYGSRIGLPSAIALVGTYWHFGPGELPGETVIAVGFELGDLNWGFASVIEVRRISNPWGVPSQQDVSIQIARGPHRTLQELWPEFEGRH